MSWFVIFSLLFLTAFAVIIVFWTWSSLKEIFTIHPKKYSESTYYWICSVILLLGLSFTLMFLLDLLGWAGWLLKESMELIVKALIY